MGQSWNSETGELGHGNRTCSIRIDKEMLIHFQISGMLIVDGIFPIRGWSYKSWDGKAPGLANQMPFLSLNQSFGKGGMVP